MFLPLQNLILEMVARGDTAEATANQLCLETENLSPDCVCSVLRVDEEGRLWTLAAPSLPADYCAAINGVAIGPTVGSCGAAAYLGRPVEISDIETHPNWAAFKARVPNELAACWSTPILGGSGAVIGTFAFYFGTKRGPNAVERSVVDACARLCGLAIERHAAEAEMRRLAFVDALTGLPNRASFNAALERLDAASDADYALLLIDVDRLKVVNDTLGHAGGDDLLRAVGRRIGRACATERPFRIGGDEFAVLLRGGGAAGRMASVAAIVSREVERYARCNGEILRPGVTIGGAGCVTVGEPIEALRQNADFALYHAKERNPGGFAAYSADLRSRMTQRFNVIRQVGIALDDARVEAHYQPVVRLDTREIVGLEALCRIRARNGDYVAACDFADAITDERTAHRITDRMFRQVASDMRDWLDADAPFQHVGVNVAGADFRRGDLDGLLVERFAEKGAPLSRVILEVTESVYMDGQDKTVAVAVEALRARGILVALDDFGTGYASLTHLQSFPVDIVKIDKSFVSRLQHDQTSAVIVEGLIGMLRKLGMRIVAEGVEDDDTAALLQTYGCALGQGYAFGRAADARTTAERLRLRGQRIAASDRADRTVRSAA